MINRYFDHINNMTDLHQEYKRLALKHHPDMGGDDKTMAAINGQYEEAVARIKRNPDTAYSNPAAAAADRKAAASEIPAEFTAAVMAALKCKGIILELVGRWLWCTGSTYEHRAALKAAGYHYASQKKAWYWHAPDDYSRGSKKTLEQIKAKYGVTRVTVTDRGAIEQPA